MADTKEVFEMITRTRPDAGALDRQRRRQQRRRRNERVLVFAFAAALVAGSAIGIATARRSTQPATSSTPTPPPAVAGQLVLEGIDVATGAVTGTIATDVAPYRSDVSPDGSLIAFVRPAEFGHGQIFVMRLDGTHERRVTGLPGQRGCGCGAIDPAWSPDATKIAFGGLNQRDGRDIYLLDVATGSIQQLTHTALAGESKPTWSPDGRSIAFEEGTPRRGCCGSETTGSIVVMDLRTGHASRVVTMRDAGAPAWSPDGRWLAFNAIAEGSGRNGLWLVRPNGARMHPLLIEPDEDTTPTWSPDSTMIAFDSGQTVAVVDLATGVVRPIGPIMDAAWSGDGRVLYGWSS